MVGSIHFDVHQIHDLQGPLFLACDVTKHLKAIIQHWDDAAMNILHFYETQCIILLTRNQHQKMSPGDSNFCSVLGVLGNYFSHNLHFLLQCRSKINLFVCAGFRIRSVCIFVLSSSSWIWFQSKQLSSLNSLLFGLSSSVTVIILGVCPCFIFVSNIYALF